MERINFAIEQIQKARNITTNLLDEIDPERWFWQPHEGVTHVAWQVAHLAMAQYRLCLGVVRGEQPGDESLCSKAFRTKYGRNSIPDPDSANQPSPAEIRRTLDAVMQQTLAESTNWTETLLDNPYDGTHPMFQTKYEALLWCAQHELMHAGQLGLLRRLMGHDPVW